MAWLIIPIIIAAILAPVFYAMPSARQKHQAQLREHAMQQGFLIKLAPMPQTHRAKVRQEEPEQGMVYRLPFQLIWPELKTRYIEPIVLVREELTSQHAYRSLKDDPCYPLLRDALEAMPPEIAAIEYAATGIGWFWEEQGDTALIDQLLIDTQALQHRLLPLIKP